MIFRICISYLLKYDILGYMYFIYVALFDILTFPKIGNKLKKSYNNFKSWKLGQCFHLHQFLFFYFLKVKVRVYSKFKKIKKVNFLLLFIYKLNKITYIYIMWYDILLFIYLFSNLVYGRLGHKTTSLNFNHIMRDLMFINGN